MISALQKNKNIRRDGFGTLIISFPTAAAAAAEPDDYVARSQMTARPPPRLSGGDRGPRARARTP